MRKLGVRVVSAALAACMVASVLPVSAFAADGAGTAGAGTSTTLPADAQELPRSGSISEGGTYTMSGEYNNRVVIDAPGKDITIKVTGPVTSTSGFLLHVQNAKSLTIHGNNNTVNVENGTFLFVNPKTGETTTITDTLAIDNVKYVCNNGLQLTGMGSTSTTTLTNVVMEASAVAVNNQSAGTVTISGGSYTKRASTVTEALLLNGAGTMVLQDNVNVTNDYGTAVRNAGGRVTISSGTFKTTGFAVQTQNGAETAVTGGTFEADDRVFINNGTLTIGTSGSTNDTTPRIVNKSGKDGAVTNSGTLNFYSGTVTTEAQNGAGVLTVGTGATTNIEGGTITGCNGGIVIQSGNPTVTVNKVTLSDNVHDIVLGNGQIINIPDAYNGTKPATLYVYDPDTTTAGKAGRQITTSNSSDNLQFTFQIGGYTVKHSDDGYYYLHKNQAYALNLVNATAERVSGADADGNETRVTVNSGTDVPEESTVYLKANASTNPKQEFDKWEVTGTGDLSGILSDVKDPNAILTMPNQAVTVKATYKNKEHKLNYGENITATVNDTNVASGEDVAVDTQVKLEAKNSDDTKEFDKWVVKDASGNEITGTELNNILTVDSSDSTKATLTMPNQAVTVEATYKTKQHELTYDKATATANGSTVNTGAPVKVGTKVELKAEPAPTNKVFDKWEVTNVSTDKVIDDLTGILDINGTDATLTMPNYPVKIEAKYKASENALTFDNATATVGGNNVNSGDQVAAGTNVSMKADLPEDEEFTGWTITVDGVDKTDELLGSTAGDPDISFTMPDGSVEVTANHTTKKNTLNYEDAAATVGGSTVNSGDPVAVGTKVDLKANDPTDDTKEFDHWEVTDANGNKITGDALDKILSDANSADTTLTMPNYEVTIKPVTRTKTNPGTDPSDPSDPGDPGTDPDDPATPSDPADTAVDPGCTIGGAIATVIVGGTAAWGVYEAGTGIYRMIYMPGIILPTTRAELAMLIWEKADKPEPESDVLFEDIDEDNTDLQKAARWMVEQDLMDEKDDNKFLPGAHVTKLRVCTTWNDAREKGLID